MILAISGINFNQKRVETSSKKGFRPQVFNADIFELSQKSNPSFSGLIPKRQIYKCCNAVLKQAGEISEHKSLMELSAVFFSKIETLARKEGGYTPENKGTLLDFRHEIRNYWMYGKGMVHDEFVYKVHKNIPLEKVFSETERFKQQKEELILAAKRLKECAYKWTVLERWHETGEGVPFEKVFGLMARIAPQRGFSVEGRELLKGKRVQKPLEFYSYVSQLFLNAIKHGDGKPFKVKFEKAVEEGRENYYITVTNSVKEPLTDEKIDKLLTTYDKEGAGGGITIIQNTLRENGYPTDNIIQKGHGNTFSIRLPLIGICD